jgi:hypothetical protein
MKEQVGKSSGSKVLFFNQTEPNTSNNSNQLKYNHSNKASTPTLTETDSDETYDMDELLDQTEPVKQSAPFKMPDSNTLITSFAAAIEATNNNVTKDNEPKKMTNQSL